MRCLHPRLVVDAFPVVCVSWSSLFSTESSRGRGLTSSLETGGLVVLPRGVLASTPPVAVVRAPSGAAASLGLPHCFL